MADDFLRLCFGQTFEIIAKMRSDFGCASRRIVECVPQIVLYIVVSHFIVKRLLDSLKAVPCRAVRLGFGRTFFLLKL